MECMRKSGGYRGLVTFQTATLIYDATYWFWETFLDHRSRAADQILQVARRGRNNIAKAYMAGTYSIRRKLVLIKQARAFLEELLLDYEDYLRQRELEIWPSGSTQAKAVFHVPKCLNNQRSTLSDLVDLTDQQRRMLYSEWLENDDPAIRANAMICLIHQINHLLEQQVEMMEELLVAERDTSGEQVA